MRNEKTTIKVNENNKTEILKQFIDEVKNPQIPIGIITVKKDGEKYENWNIMFHNNGEGMKVYNGFKNDDEAEEFTRQIVKQTNGISPIRQLTHNKTGGTTEVFREKVKQWINED